MEVLGDREREYVGVCGEREGSRVQKGSNAPDGAGSIGSVGDMERAILSGSLGILSGAASVSVSVSIKPTENRPRFRYRPRPR